MKIQQFTLSRHTEEAFRVVREYLEAHDLEGIELTDVGVVRWCIHRAARGVEAERQEAMEGGSNGEDS